MIPEGVEGERAVLVLVPDYTERPVALRSAQLDLLRTAVGPSFAIDAVEQRVELPDAVDELAPTVTPSRLEAQ